MAKCVWLGVATETKSTRSPAGSFASAGDHLRDGAIGTCGGDVVIGGGRLGSGGVGGEGAGDEAGTIVEGGGDAVDLADEGALSAADQAHAELAIQGCVDGHGRGTSEGVADAESDMKRQ